MAFEFPSLDSLLNKPAPSAGLKRVGITGAGGLIGKRLTTVLTAQGVTVTPIATNYKSGDYSPVDPASMEGLDVVIHLAGENVASGEGPLGFLGRWSDAKKSKIMESRVEGTAALVAAMAGLKKKPKALVTASGLGYYGYTDPAMVFDETSGRGSGFLADVCERWEAETVRASAMGVKTAVIRFGVVLSPLGGAVAKLFPLFFLGVGGVLGSGQQPFSFVTLNDAVRAVLFVAEKRGALAGPINVCSPSPCSNADFTAAFGAALGRPTVFPLPQAVGSVVFGQMGDEMLFNGQRAVPSKLTRAGFKFQDVEINAAMKSCLQDN